MELARDLARDRVLQEQHILLKDACFRIVFLSEAARAKSSISPDALF